MISSNVKGKMLLFLSYILLSICIGFIVYQQKQLDILSDRISNQDTYIFERKISRLDDKVSNIENDISSLKGTTSDNEQIMKSNTMMLNSLELTVDSLKNDVNLLKFSSYYR